MSGTLRRIGRLLAWLFVVACFAGALVGARVHDYGLASWYLLIGVLAQRELQPPRVKITFHAPPGVTITLGSTPQSTEVRDNG